MKDITGYTTAWSVEPGEELPFKVNCEAEEYRAAIVRLICGDTHPEGPGVKEAEIGAAVDGRYDGREQEIHAGSHIRVDDDGAFSFDGGFTLQAFVYPTTPEKGVQGLLTKWTEDESAGYGLFIGDEGDLSFRLRAGDGDVERVGTGKPLEPDTWYFVGAAVDPGAGTVHLWQRPQTADQHKLVYPMEDHSADEERSVAAGTIDHPNVPFMLAASAGRSGGRIVGERCFNGKLDRPRVSSRALTLAEARSVVSGRSPEVGDDLVAAWDFSAGITPDGVEDYEEIVDATAHNRHGEAINMPTRGVTGHNWTKETHEFTEAPEQYGAIHFHDDDLGDARWETDFTWRVPDGTESGVYAARLRTAEDEYYVPFFVRPPAGTATASIAFLAPTASYLAYANDHLVTDHAATELLIGHTPIMQQNDLFLADHREYGISCYDTHSDGYGSFYSSRYRPILTMSPKYKHWLSALPSSLWQFNADLHLVDWLEEKDFEYDVITDHDLHREGMDVLEHYDVVLTGTHPEYYSEEMWSALETYQHQGGRLMYMGANGFYWIIGFHPDGRNIIEIRKGDTGIRAYSAPPGEKSLSFTGHMGGLWRQRGQAPQKLTGVGFVGEGFDVSSYYRRQPDSYDDATAFIFEDVDDEIIGDFGTIGRGAAGLELDKVDESLGTPSHARLLASSEGHTDNVVLVTEEILATTPGALSGTDNPDVRADMVYYKTPEEGAVFSTGSIAWCGSLSHDDYDNNVSRITENVLEAFANEETLPE